jgi:hypothetical protein
MADKNVYTHLIGNKNELRDWAIENLASDPTAGGLYTGRVWFNTTDSKLRGYNGTAVVTYATLADITAIGTFQGVHNPSAGAVPSTTLDGSAIVAGDFWRVSAVGTIAGILGADALEIGDLIFANIAGASVAADFTAIQVNLSLPGNIGQVEEVTLASLPANTVTAIPTTFVNAYNVQAFNSSNEEIQLKIAGPITAPTAESNQALTNIKFRITGN